VLLPATRTPRAPALFARLNAPLPQAPWWAPAAPPDFSAAARATVHAIFGGQPALAAPAPAQGLAFGAPPPVVQPLRPWAPGASRAPAPPPAFASAAPRAPPRAEPARPRAPCGGGEEDPIELLDSDSDAPPPPAEADSGDAASDEVVVVDEAEISTERRERWERERLRRQERRRARAAASRTAGEAENVQFWAQCDAPKPHVARVGEEQQHWAKVATDWRTQNMDAATARAAEEAAARAPALLAAKKAAKAKRAAVRAAKRAAQDAAAEEAEAEAEAAAPAAPTPAPPPAPTPAPQPPSPPAAPAPAAAPPPAARARAAPAPPPWADELAKFVAETAARRAAGLCTAEELAGDEAVLNAERVLSALLAAQEARMAEQAEEEAAAAAEKEATAATAAAPAAPVNDAPDGGDGTADPGVVLDRAAGRDAAADAAEWEARAVELARQREAAARERARRRNEAARAAELAARQTSRVVELRASAAAAAAAAGEDDRLRTLARTSLQLLTQHCTTLGALLAALDVPPAGWPLSGPREVAAAYRSAALRFHPDRGRATRTPAEAVFAEEAFKLIAKMKHDMGA
jgi:hypothetical protein